MRAIYFCDPLDDDGNKQDLEVVRSELKRLKLPSFHIELMTLPPWDEAYDLLFFDWGGLSLGNSMMEHFCEYFIEQAKEKPGVAFVMTSNFTAEAMKDALEMFLRDNEGQPTNIFLDIASAANWIRVLISKKPNSQSRQKARGK